MRFVMRQLHAGLLGIESKSLGPYTEHSSALSVSNRSGTNHERYAYYALDYPIISPIYIGDSIYRSNADMLYAPTTVLLVVHGTLHWFLPLG